jgi:hypothetical protein
MPTHLAEHFHQQRLCRGLSLGQLARLVGYRNVSRGANRIQTFEQRGEVHPDLLSKLCDVLCVHRASVEMLLENDRRDFFEEWIVWANQPINPHIVVRLIPAFYITEPLPEGITSQERAEIFASERARHWKRKCCLVLTRRYSVWFDEQGIVYERTEALPGEPNTPYLRLGRRADSFLVRLELKGIKFEQLTWPGRTDLSRTLPPRKDVD